MLLKLISAVSFYFFNVATRKFLITYMTPIMFLLDNTHIESQFFKKNCNKVYLNVSFVFLITLGHIGKNFYYSL